MLTPPEAQAAILARVPAARPETLPLTSLEGRILRQPVFAERDQPPFNRVAMDGVALASSAWERGHREFRVVGIQAAGAPQSALPDLTTCLEVMTGAVLPAGCDCVVPVEKLERSGDAVRLADDVAVMPWLNVHVRGLDSRSGDRLLEPGTLLGAPEIAIVASAGLAYVEVAAQPRVMVISTGDELVEPGEPVEDWQIRRSNAYAVVATLQRYGFTKVSHDHLPDDLDVLRERLRVHLDTHDTLILSGGVSMGRFDFVPQVLGELDVETVFHKVSQRPGKPMWFGVRAPDKAVYALPGNPVSTLVSCVRYVIPGLYATMGAEPVVPAPVVLESAIDVPALAIFLPVKVMTDAAGKRVASPRPTKGSGDFIALKGTDGFVALPAGPRTAAAGSLADFYPW